jgi:hypothetical protein
MRLSFQTAEVQLPAVAFASPLPAMAYLQRVTAALQEFTLALQDGVRTEADYRVWKAAQAAPVTLRTLERGAA